MDKRIERFTYDGENEQNKYYAYWLCSLSGIGNRTIWKLLGRYNTPQEIFKASKKELEQILTKKQMESVEESRERWQLEEAYKELKSRGIGFLTYEEDGYPQRLTTIPDAPYGLFFKGILPKEEQISVAIIGARDCSEYGRYVADGLGRYLGEHGVQVISGMARGIDGISQEAALDAGGLSFGVLGCGVDICYPRQNQRLYDRLLEKGGILSTYPLGSQPRPQNFPPRNRIVSGLADAVIVIEARQKSGTLITVDMALEQGRDVYVVPGRVTDRLSDGCNSLLKQGAEVFLSPEELLRELQEGQKRKQPKIKVERNFESEDTPINSGKGYKAETELKRRGNHAETKVESKENEESTRFEQKLRNKRESTRLEPELEQVCKVLDFYPSAIEEIKNRLPEGYDVQALSGMLMRLCLEDVAMQVSPGHFCLKG